MIKRLTHSSPIRFLKTGMTLVLCASMLACSHDAGTHKADIVNFISKPAPASPIYDAAPKAANGTGKLIPIDFRDKVYSDMAFYAKDTVTAGGWTIRYLVKDDTTRYTDIYIRWNKGKTSGLYSGGDILLLRRYFIPQFVGENSTHLFFRHACATNCAALLVLSKEKNPQAHDYSSMRAYDIPSGRLGYLKDLTADSDTLKGAAVDLKRKQEIGFGFKNSCKLLPQDGCIDSVHFGKNDVQVFATLTGRNDRHNIKTIRESQTLTFGK